MSTKSLPHRDEDPVLIFYAHYFCAADLMRDNYQKLEAKRQRNGRLSRNDAVNWSIYFCTWLGYLGVACESFRGLNVRLLLRESRPDEFRELVPLADGIGKTMKQHYDPLRKFRNSVFHLRGDAEDMKSFLSKQDSRLEWAGGLHEELGNFCSNYRILCQVHYVMNERFNEVDSFKRKQQH